MLAFRSIVLAFAPAIVSHTVAQAQIRASERGNVSQTVDGTVITVNYGRAQVRGRDSLFGKVVTPGEIWTPGANQATTIEFSREVRLAGRQVPAGKYSLWIVTEPAQWTLSLNKNAALFHTAHPKPSEMLVSIPVTRIQGEHVEVLTFDFPRVSQDGCELRLRWGTVIMPVAIVVHPSQPAVVMTDEQLAPFLGSYALTFPSPRGRSPEIRFEIVSAKGMLRGIADDPKNPFQIQFLPTDRPNRFLPAFLQDGKILDVEVAMPIAFNVIDGRAASFTGGDGPNPFWVGTRRK